MIRKILWIIFCQVFLIVGVYGQSCNQENIFNSGLNYGWLQAATSCNMFSNHWVEYSQNGAIFYNHAFSPPRQYKAPAANFEGSQTAIDYIEKQLRPIQSGALQVLFLGGVHLAKAHILAQWGKSPAGLRAEIRTAGNYLKDAGIALNNQRLKDIGLQLDSLYQTVNVSYISPQEYKDYINKLAYIIMDIQKAVRQ